MLEIIFITILCKKMGSNLRAKGWETTVWMQILVVIVYLVSLFLGAISYGIYMGLTHGQEALDDLGWMPYLAAYIGVAIGMSMLFGMTMLFSDKSPSRVKDFQPAQKYIHPLYRDPQ